MTEKDKQSIQPFAWYWYDQHGCLYITGDDRKPDLPADAQPLYTTEQNKQSDTPASMHVEALEAIRELSLLDDEIGSASAIVMSRMADIYQHADATLALTQSIEAFAPHMSETTPVSETDGAAISDD